MFFYSIEYGNKYFEHNMKCLSQLNSSCVQKDELGSYTVIIQFCQTSGPHRHCDCFGEEKNLSYASNWPPITWLSSLQPGICHYYKENTVHDV